MLTMKKADYEKILAHAKENLPEEACGLIAGTKDGDKKIIEKVYLLENVDHTNEHFSMNPKDQLAAVKDMRANKLVPLGNWHSHPESPSRPSEEDKRRLKNWLFSKGYPSADRFSIWGISRKRYLLCSLEIVE